MNKTTLTYKMCSLMKDTRQCSKCLSDGFMVKVLKADKADIWILTTVIT